MNFPLWLKGDFGLTFLKVGRKDLTLPGTNNNKNLRIKFYIAVVSIIGVNVESLLSPSALVIASYNRAAVAFYSPETIMK